MKKLKETTYKYRYGFLSMLIVLLAWVTFFFLSDVVPFGKEYFMPYDSRAQYMPFLKEFKRFLSGDTSLFISWNIGAGTDFWTNISYYLSSPFNLLLIFIKENTVPIFMTWMIPLKSCLAAFAMSWFIINILKINDYSTGIFASIWGLSSYTVCYSFNIMWMDVLIIYPLLIASFIDLMKTGKKRWYIFWLALSIWCCFYMSIMVCMSLVVLFFVFNDWHKDTWAKGFLNFSLSSLTAGGVCAVLLLPAVMTLLSTNGSVPITSSFYTSFAKILSQFFIGAEISPVASSYWFAPVYCSVGCLYCVLVYFVSRNYERKEKIMFGAGILVLIFSLNYMPLNYLFHGFRLPTCFANRFSFFLIFLFIICGIKGFQSIKTENNKNIFYMIAVVLAFIVLVAPLDMEYKIINIVVLLILSLFCVKRYGLLFVFIMVFELFINSYIISIPAMKTIRELSDETVEVLNEVKLEDYQTFAGETEVYQNGGLFADLKSVALFSSMSPNETYSFQKMGFLTGANVVRSLKLNPFQTSLFGIKYNCSSEDVFDNADFEQIISRDIFYKEQNTTKHIYLYRDKKDVSRGHLFPNSTKGIELSDDRLENVNSFYKSLGNSEDEIYADFTDQLNYEKTDKNYIYTREYYSANLLPGKYVLSSRDNAGIIIVNQFNGENLISSTKNEKISDILEEFIISEDCTKVSFEITYSHTLKETKFDENGDLIKTLKLYKINENNFNEFVNIVDESAVYDFKIDKNKIVATNNRGTGIYTVSTIYSPGWSVKIDGKERNTVKVFGALLGVEVNEDDRKIEFTYKTPYIDAGLKISIFFLLVYSAIIIVEKRRLAQLTKLK